MSVRGTCSNDPRLEHSRRSFAAATLQASEYSYGVGSLTFIVLLLSHLVHALCHTALGSGVCVSTKLKSCSVYKDETVFPLQVWSKLKPLQPAYRMCVHGPPSPPIAGYWHG
jgi:hypothetical protein